MARNENTNRGFIQYIMKLEGIFTTKCNFIIFNEQNVWCDKYEIKFSSRLLMAGNEKQTDDL